MACLAQSLSAPTQVREKPVYRLPLIHEHSQSALSSPQFRVKDCPCSCIRRTPSSSLWRGCSTNSRNASRHAVSRAMASESVMRRLLVSWGCALPPLGLREGVEAVRVNVEPDGTALLIDDDLTPDYRIVL